MIKAVIFDCFGVVITDTLESTYTRFGGDFQKDLKEIIEICRKSDKGEISSSAPYFAQLLGVTESTYTTAIAEGRIVNQELLDYVNELKKDYRVAMLSNVGKGRLPQIFGEGFLEKYFELIVASGDIGYAKPEASAYEYVAEKLGVRLDECVFTDDRPEYIEGAVGVGMKTILFSNLEQFKKDLTRILE
ncbi:MAG: HAD family phosphatase [bacterium]|nr:HAD family phosphatase [bacterium]